MVSKIKSMDELKKIREQALQNTQIRATAENPDRIVLAVGMATCGIAAGAREAMAALLQEVEREKLTNVSVITTGCAGYCHAEPLVEVRMPGREKVFYGHVDAHRARMIIQKHILHGELLDQAIVGQGVSKT